MVKKVIDLPAIPQKTIRQFCTRWSVVEFSLFGSILREDFTPLSDIDVLVEFSGSANPSLFDMVQMKLELEKVFRRPVDLVEKKSLSNPFRKREILDSARVIYAR